MLLTAACGHHVSRCFFNPAAPLLHAVMLCLILSSLKLSRLLLCFVALAAEAAPWGGVIRPSKCEYLPQPPLHTNAFNFLHEGTHSTDHSSFRSKQSNQIVFHVFSISLDVHDWPLFVW